MELGIKKYGCAFSEHFHYQKYDDWFKKMMGQVLECVGGEVDECPSNSSE